MTTKLYKVTDLAGKRPVKLLDERGLFYYLGQLDNDAGRERDVVDMSIREVLEIFAEDYWIDIIEN